jgi:acylphosphatase
MAEHVRKRVIISGIVQGVAFRHYTREMAGKLGVTGWVRNLPNGNVEAVFEGDPEDVLEAANWCRQGPPSARVDEAQVMDEDYKGEFSTFDVAYTPRRM